MKMESRGGWKAKMESKDRKSGWEVGMGEKSGWVESRK